MESPRKDPPENLVHPAVEEAARQAANVRPARGLRDTISRDAYTAMVAAIGRESILGMVRARTAAATRSE